MKKGFTMVELIGAIAILGILLLLAVPTIGNSVEKSKQKSLDRIIDNIIESSYNYSVQNRIGYNGIIDLSELQNSGFLKRKDLINPVTNENLIGCVRYNWNESIKQYKFEYTTECGIKTYNEGELLKIEVGTSTFEYFYVLEDNGSTITAIMNRNISDNVAWASLEDIDTYFEENEINVTGLTNEQLYDVYQTMGPLTANKQIENLRWNNVSVKRLPTMLEIIGRTKWYENLTQEEKLNWEDKYFDSLRDVTSVLNCSTNSDCRAFINEYEENAGLKENSILLPTWLDINLYTSGDDSIDNNGNHKYGYWTSTPISVYPYLIWDVYGFIYVDEVNYNVDSGVRPVITIDKAYIVEKQSMPIYVNDSN